MTVVNNLEAVLRPSGWSVVNLGSYIPAADQVWASPIWCQGRRVLENSTYTVLRILEEKKNANILNQ